MAWRFVSGLPSSNFALVVLVADVSWPGILWKPYFCALPFTVVTKWFISLFLKPAQEFQDIPFIVTNLRQILDY
jgi:hypothetical protein